MDESPQNWQQIYLLMSSHKWSTKSPNQFEFAQARSQISECRLRFEAGTGWKAPTGSRSELTIVCLTLEEKTGRRRRKEAGGCSSWPSVRPPQLGCGTLTLARLLMPSRRRAIIPKCRLPMTRFCLIGWHPLRVSCVYDCTGRVPSLLP